MDQLYDFCKPICPKSRAVVNRLKNTTYGYKLGGKFAVLDRKVLTEK